MAHFLFALLAAACAAFGSHAPVHLARLSAATGPSRVLLGAAWLGGAGAASIAAWSGAGLAGAADGATSVLVIAGLLVAALTTVTLRAGPSPREPTRSFGAAVLVLGTVQLAAAPGLVTLALTAAIRTPWPVSAGAALGMGAVMTLAWSMAADWERRLPTRSLRFLVAGLLLAAALLAAWPDPAAG